jgi:hypothetical protein
VRFVQLIVPVLIGNNVYEMSSVQTFELGNFTTTEEEEFNAFNGVTVMIAGLV